MLKLEDLKVGDKIEFINNEARQAFIKKHESNKETSDLFNPSNTITKLLGFCIALKGDDVMDVDDGEEVLFKQELKYFRKVVEARYTQEQYDVSVPAKVGQKVTIENICTTFTGVLKYYSEEYIILEFEGEHLDGFKEQHFHTRSWKIKPYIVAQTVEEKLAKEFEDNWRKCFPEMELEDGFGLKAIKAGLVKGGDDEK